MTLVRTCPHVVETGQSLLIRRMLDNMIHPKLIPNSVLANVIPIEASG